MTNVQTYSDRATCSRGAKRALKHNDYAVFENTDKRWYWLELNADAERVDAIEDVVIAPVAIDTTRSVARMTSRNDKLDAVYHMTQRKGGATIAEMMTALHVQEPTIRSLLCQNNREGRTIHSIKGVYHVGQRA